MIRRSLWIVLLVPFLLVACGPGEVIVTSEVERSDPDTGEQVMRPVQNMEVQLLPYDRDAIFDSLTQAAATPEPQLPPELLAARDTIQQAQATFRDAENRVLSIRERLAQINEEMQQYNPAETRYSQLFTQFNELEGQLNQAENVRDENFERFTELQRETFEELEQARIQIQNWEDEAFADFELVVAERLSETRREIVTDTTDATGRAQLSPAPGEYWVYARTQLPVEELYWNIRVDVERGDPLEVRLTRENAEIREIF
ncbi:MAG: hypothetical protein WD960_00425 [Gemmatimonadota bacterium]